MSNVTRYGYRYNFYQAVRLLAGPQPEVHLELETLDKRLEFRTESGNQFPASDIQEVRKEGDRHRVVVNCFGISGPRGPLPETHSDWINSEHLHGKHQLKRFLELFNHRLICLLFLVKKRCWIGLHSGEPKDSELYRYLTYIGNLASTHSRGSGYPEGMNLQGFSGLLAGDRVSVPRIEGVVAAHLEAPVKVQSFGGAFVPVDEDHRTVLSQSPTPLNTLGSARIIGTQVWRQDYAIRLDVGPVDYETAVELQPGNERYKLLEDLLLHVTDSRWVIDLDLLVRKSTIPKSGVSNSRLNGIGSGPGLSVGYNAWIKSGDWIETGDPDKPDIRRTRRVIKPFSVH